MDEVSVQLAGTVPEPSSLLMVGTAVVLGGTGVVARWHPARSPGRTPRRTDRIE
jgi:hypothetical protein